jgi:hypothetical protein
VFFSNQVFKRMAQSVAEEALGGLTVQQHQSS